MTIDEMYNDCVKQGIFNVSDETVEFLESLFRIYKYKYIMSDELINTLKKEISDIYNEIKSSIVITNKNVYILKEYNLSQEHINFIESLPHTKKVEISYEY